MIRAQHLPAAIADEIYNDLTKRYMPWPFPKYGLAFRLHINMGFPVDKYVKKQSAAANFLNAQPPPFKFVIVRHPFNRIVSAFRSKFYGICEGDRACFADKFLDVDMKRTDEVSFDEFIDGLVKRNPHEVNVHFRPMVCGTAFSMPHLSCQYRLFLSKHCLLCEDRFVLHC